MFKKNDQKSYYWTSRAGLKDIHEVAAAYYAEQKEADKKALKEKLALPTHQDFVEYFAKRPHTEPADPPESVFKGVTNLRVVKPVEKGYYENLLKELNDAEGKKLAQALSRTLLPDGHPRKLEMVVEKVH